MSEAEQTAAAPIAVGTPVLWVPGEQHALDRAADGGRCWAFVYADKKGGDVPQSELADPKLLARNKAGDVVLGRNRRPIRADKPRATFAGKVTGVSESGGGTYALDVADPNGCATHHLLAKYDPHGKAPGTFHLQGE